MPIYRQIEVGFRLRHPYRTIKPVFRGNTEIQAFLLPMRNSLGCIFAVSCEKMQLFFTRFHTKKRRYNVMKESSSLAGAGVLI